MAEPLAIAGACFAAYLAGSLPFGKWVAATRGVDILKEGSGNIGATNVWRVLGAPFGIAVLAFDVFKGFAPSYWMPLAVGAPVGSPSWGILFGACAVVGHSCSPFLKFRGGKSVATALGVMIAVSPAVALVSLAVFLLTLLLSRYVSLSSILGALAAPITALAFVQPPVVVYVYAALATLIILRHVPNIRRLISGTEPKFGSKPGSEP